MNTYVLRAGRLVPRTRGRTAEVAIAAAPVALITGLGAALRLWSFGRVGANPPTTRPCAA